MAKREWTPNQKDAFNARGMQILVSAAAGSGKTAVLTERVKNIVTDSVDPCDVSELLVVTFTRAAAGEMKDRIHKALTKCDTISKDKIREQLIALPLADICTIDSFCSKIVKDNFKRADVSADYLMLDDKDEAEMNEAAVDEVINALYETNDNDFIKLTSMLIGDKDDSKLSDVILDMYKYSRSFPSPEGWLNKLYDDFSPNKHPNDTAWAPVIYKHIILFCDCYIKRFEKALDMINDEGNFTPEYCVRFEVTKDNLVNLKACAESNNWDGMIDLINEGIKYAPRASTGEVDEYIKELAKDVFSGFDDDLKSIVKLSLPTSQQHKDDCRILQPMVKVLCDAVKLLDKNLCEEKKKRNAYSFNDILHKCINVLVKFTGDGEDDWEPTDIAKTLQNKYKEIFIDEYQDTNHAQNIIFKAVSRDMSNLYFVGDVKQSIYKFRLASPSLFMDLKKSLNKYDGAIKQPSLIRLDKNFRSRKGVLDVSNDISFAMMSESVGEIDYNSEEELVLGADYYPEKPDPDVGLLCFDYTDKSSSEAKLLEAEQVAAFIKCKLNENIEVYDGDEKTKKRPLEASDICILLRAMKNKAPFYVDALNKIGIPANTVSNEDTSLSKEIQFLVALVKAISNPLDDISLVSVMFSPVFGFTADELAKIRLTDKYKEIFVNVGEYAKTSEKAAYFIKKMQLYRNIAASYPINEFVKFIVKDTDILNVYLAGNDGVSRSANIRGFVEFAESFTQSGRVGLNAFVKSIDATIKNEKMVTYSGMAALEGVKIMSIHKSKGLEFPYVILADCSGEFSNQDSKKTLKISRNTGIGLQIRDDKSFTKYHTLSSAATTKDIEYGEKSELLRVLYVAMTRAKENLTFVCSLKDRDWIRKKVRLNSFFDYDSKGKLHPYCVYKGRSFADWVLSRLALHRDCQIVRDICGIVSVNEYESGYSMNVSSALNPDSFEAYINSDESPLSKSSDDEAFEEYKNQVYDRLNEISSFNYEYDCSGILAKRTASSTEQHFDDRRYFAVRKPSFMKKNITGADRGTAIHKFFEICNLQNAASDFDGEINNLTLSGKLDENEASVLTKNDAQSFFNSALGKRLLASDEVLREYEFAFLKKAGELYEGISSKVEDEEVVIQGKLDCAFREDDGYVLIDYKSDNIKDENDFKTIYKPQLDIYSEALTQCTGLKVKEKYVYSFKLQKFIEI